MAGQEPREVCCKPVQPCCNRARTSVGTSPGVSLTEQMDFGSPAGKVMFSVISAMAEFERDLIRERVKLGMERARQDGKHVGRPPSMPVF